MISLTNGGLRSDCIVTVDTRFVGLPHDGHEIRCDAILDSMNDNLDLSAYLVNHLVHAYYTGCTQVQCQADFPTKEPDLELRP